MTPSECQTVGLPISTGHQSRDRRPATDRQTFGGVDGVVETRSEPRAEPKFIGK